MFLVYLYGHSAACIYSNAVTIKDPAFNQGNIILQYLPVKNESEVYDNFAWIM